MGDPFEFHNGMEGTYTLVTALCTHLAKKNTDRKSETSGGLAGYVPRNEKEKLIQSEVNRNKALSFEILLKKKIVKRHRPVDYGEMSNQDQLFSSVFELKQSGEHDKAELLEKVTDKFCENEGLDKDSPLNNIITFLLALKDSQTDRQQSSTSLVSIGDSIDFYHQNSRLNIPAVPVYGRIYSFNSGRKEYIQYPDSLFKLPPTLGWIAGHSPLPQYSAASFQPPPLSEAQLQLDTALGLDTDPSRVYKRQQNSPVASEDEGYASPSREDPTEVWDKIWEVEESKRRTWLCLGQRIPDREKCYLSEAGGDAVHHAWKIASHHLHLIDPSCSFPTLTPITLRNLITDVGYLLAGIPSTTFMFWDAVVKFSIKPGICLAALTPEAAAAACSGYLAAGAIVKRLEMFCNDPEAKLRGLIFNGFRQGIQSFLSVYSSAVVSLSRKLSTLGELELGMEPLRQQVIFLGGMCNLMLDPGGWECLPNGVHLLSFLLDVSVHVSSKHIHLNLVSILRSTAAPYFRFLQSWLFSGECEDTYKEFGLEVDIRCLTARDHIYWEQAYRTSPLESTGGGSFLADIQHMVHLTGKSLALLRLIHPTHHLGGQFRELHPRVALAVSVQQQAELRKTCGVYERRLVAAAEELTESLASKRRKEEERRVEEARKVRERHDRRVAELEKFREEENEVERVRKRERREEIQQQVEERQERKIKEKRDKIEEERRYEEETKRMDEEIARREAEEAARLEAFYEELSRQAEVRERRNEWRIRRTNLRDKRSAFHRKEKDLLENEIKMQEKVPQKGVSDEVDRGTLSWKSVELKLDEMSNVIVTIMDNEGNIVTDSFEDFHLFSQDVNNQIMAGSFQTLPLPLQQMLVQSVYWKQTLSQSHQETSPTLPSLANANNLPPPANNQNIPTRHDNKKLVLSSNIPFYMEHPENDQNQKRKSRNVSVEKDSNANPLEDDADGVRKRSGPRPIEEILYPRRYLQPEKDDYVERRTEIVVNSVTTVAPYKKSYPELESFQEFKVMGGKAGEREVADGQAFAPLSLILQTSILVPLRVQTKLVNAALLNHLLVDRQLMEHFTALRNYLLLADGEFGGQLVISLCQLGNSLDEADLPNQLVQHLHGRAPPPHLLGPAPLNRVLDAALGASLTGSSDPMAENLTFVLRGVTPGGLGIPGLSLSYRCHWPANLVLTDEVVSRYSSLMDFLLGLRMAILALTLDWSSGRGKASKGLGAKAHRVCLMRHEMLNFLRNLHAYVAAQVLEVSWSEFQDNLNSKVNSLDELIDAHNKYVNRALFRCLLNQKAAPVMKIITDILTSITNFSRMVSTLGVGLNSKGEENLESNWTGIHKQYGVFKQYSRFLYSVVWKLSARGYQPHLQDLLSRLNFNGFYDNPK